jgi:hypothetical protein
MSISRGPSSQRVDLERGCLLHCVASYTQIHMLRSVDQFIIEIYTLGNISIMGINQGILYVFVHYCCIHSSDI